MLEERILVISDDPELRELLRRHLAPDNYRLLYSRERGDNLGKTVDKAAPSLVILDISMQGIRGVETCLRLRQLADVPIIMLSAWDEEKAQGFDPANDDYLSEPFEYAELKAQVKSALRRSIAG
ncbi:MAG: response regulator transcription factor [Chloroflexi bacterium]|nr:response regulator transcription factor [Chloroflexota bacterium]